MESEKFIGFFSFILLLSLLSSFGYASMFSEGFNYGKNLSNCLVSVGVLDSSGPFISDPQILEAFIEKYAYPIIETFHLEQVFGPDPKEFLRKLFKQYYPSSITIKKSVDFGFKPFPYEVVILREGKEVRDLLFESDTIILNKDDVILLKPREPPAEVPVSDWLVPGVFYDSPPVYRVSPEFLEKLFKTYKSKYHYSGRFVRDNTNRRWVGDGYGCTRVTVMFSDRIVSSPEEILPFRTQKKKIASIPSTYVAQNGYEAYVIPLYYRGLKGGVVFFDKQVYAGVQLFVPKITLEEFKNICKIKKVDPYDKGPEIPIKAEITEEGYLRMDVNKIVELGVKKGFLPIRIKIECDPYKNYYAAMYVDKIFIKDSEGITEIDADWYLDTCTVLVTQIPFIETPILYIADLKDSTLEALFKIDFSWRFDTRDSVTFFVQCRGCPEGFLDKLKFYWDLGNGVKKEGPEVFATYEEGTYIVTLTVKDEYGRERTIIKPLTISLPSIKIWAENTFVGEKVPVHIDTPFVGSHKFVISIYKVNDKLQREFAVLDGYEVAFSGPAHKKILVGPLYIPGRYIIEAQEFVFDDETKTTEYGFTVKEI